MSAAAFSLLAAIAVTIVLLHLLKPRAQRLVVASTLLWASLLRHRKQRDRRWRWWLSLALSLAIGASLGLALISWDGFVGSGGARLAIVIDDSSSMGARTRDGRTRFAHALDEARKLIEAGPARVLVMDTMGAAPLSGFVARPEALAILQALRVVDGGVAQLPGALDDKVPLHVVTDGVAALAVPERAVVHSVFEPAQNVAVTALDVRALPTDPTRFEAFVQVFNASPGPVHTRVTLRAARGFALSQELDLQAGELVDATFDVSSVESGVLAAAALTRDDALALDDVAYALVPDHRVRQLVLVTRGDLRLEDCLRALPGWRVRTIAPAQYRDDLVADAFVFDGFAPARAPTAGALLFHAPAVQWLPGPVREAGLTGISDWAHGHPLTDGVDWADLRIRRVALRTADQALVSAQSGAIVSTGQARAPWVSVGFTVHESNFALQPGFPVFVGNALSWLVDGEPAAVRGIGTVHLPLADAVVTDGSGHRVTARATPGGTVFEAARPDVYTAQAGARHLQIVASLQDPRVADINHSRLGERAVQPVPKLSSASTGEAWVVMLLVAVALLLFEWFAYTRRVTG